MRKILFICFLLLFVLCACGKDDQKSISNADPVQNEKDKDEDETVLILNPKNPSSDENDDQIDDEIDDKNDDGEKNKENTYTLYCNDTVTVEEDDMITKYKLVIFATGNEGSGNSITFTGNILLDYGLDASQFTGIGGAPIEGIGGFNISQFAQDFTFNVESFDLDKYAKYGTDTKEGELVIPPLISAQSMALITPNMSGTGHLGVTITGQTDSQGGYVKAETGETSIDGSGPVVMKMYISDGMVTIEVPSLKKAMGYKSFDAILTKNSSIRDQAEEIAKKEFDSIVTNK